MLACNVHSRDIIFPCCLQNPPISVPTPTPATVMNAALYLQGPNVWQVSVPMYKLCIAELHCMTSCITGITQHASCT